VREKERKKERKERREGGKEEGREGKERTIAITWMHPKCIMLRER
jgi:hypothetical protein